MNDLEVLRADLVAARLPQRRTRVAVLALAAATTITAAALAANHYLGQPAPAHVGATFAKLIDDPRWPVKPVLRETAKLLAFSPHGVLYGAQAKNGSDCLEFFTTGGATYWVFCGVNTGPAAIGDKRMTVVPSMLFHGTAASPPPYVVVGRAAAGTTIEARLPDKRMEHVSLGLRGYFVFEPKFQAAARRGEIELIERDRARTIIDRTRIPLQIVVDSVGSPIRRINGYVATPRARHASFTVVGPRGEFGTIGSTTIRTDGTFSWRVPRVKWRQWSVSILLVDDRFMPVDPSQDYWPVPDARVWQQARAEAARG